MSILDDLYAVMLTEVGTARAVPDQWKRYLTALGYTQSTVIGQMQAFAEDNGMSIMSALNYVASGAAGPGEEDTVPDAPTIGTATAGDEEATVTFTPPVDDGGAAITEYTVTSSPGSITGVGAASPITVTGLTNDVEYTFTVIATNSVGASAPSAASNAVTPEAEVAELIINGGFDADTNWTLSASCTISGGKGNKAAAGAAGNFSQAFAFENGATYRVTYTIDSISGGTINCRFINGTGANVTGSNRSTPGTYQQDLVAVDQTTFAINCAAATVAVIDNVSMIKL